MNLKRPWTRELLEDLTHKQLDTVYTNALASFDPEAAEVLNLFEEHGLLARRGGGYKKGHRLIHEMEQICRSAEGNEAALTAARAGQAPMAGVDPVLRDRLGPEYGQRDSTSWAGTLVGEEMEALGWKRHGRKALPFGCVAKTAAFYLPPKGNAD